MGGSHETPFKMKGSSLYGLGNSSPAKDKEADKEHTEAQKHNTKGEHVNEWGETPDEYSKRTTEMGLQPVETAETEEKKKKAETELFE